MSEINIEKKETVEKEIRELEEKLAEKKAELLAPAEKRENNLTEQEAVLESILEEPVPSVISDTSRTASQIATKTPADEDLSGEEKFEVNQLKKMDKESQLKFLVNISFKKGLDEGVKLARVLNNAYLIDEFHDQLIDEFYKKLVEEKKLEEL